MIVPLNSMPDMMKEEEGKEGKHRGCTTGRTDSSSSSSSQENRLCRRGTAPLVAVLCGPVRQARPAVAAHQDKESTQGSKPEHRAAVVPLAPHRPCLSDTCPRVVAAASDLLASGSSVPVPPAHGCWCEHAHVCSQRHNKQGLTRLLLLQLRLLLDFNPRLSVLLLPHQLPCAPLRPNAAQATRRLLLLA
jgi:hypothetical protein